MKKSVRLKITAIFIGITALLILAVCLANTFFLQPYYEKRKVGEMEAAYDAVCRIMEDTESTFLSDMFGDAIDPDSAQLPYDGIFRELSDRSNIDTVLLDTRNNVFIGLSREDSWLVSKLETYIEFSDLMQDQLPKSMYSIVREHDDYIIQRTFDKRTGSTFLESWGKLPDQTTYFLMSIPLTSIAESASIMNHFTFVVGLLVLVIGSLIIWFATDAVTRPLNRLAQIAKKISELDFSEKYEGTGEDEIAVLGNSINTMSDTLDRTITDLQNANTKLQEDIDLKEKIDVMRKDFISNVSHELKTPIALIEGYAEGLVEGLGEDPETRDYYCNVIMDESAKMNKMVKQLTSLTNYEFGVNTLTIEEFNLSELVKNVLLNHSIAMKEKGAVLITSIPESCIAMADEFKIEEVVTNYLTNALNHLDGEKRIIVCMERKDVRTVRLSVYNDGERIPEESLPRIWEKFYKVDKARTREYGGSGIGLSIVKAVMEAHGQEYGVTNKDAGVEFYITLDSVQ